MIEFSELDKMAIMLQTKAYAKGYQDAIDGEKHEDKGKWYNTGYASAYAEQAVITHQTEQQEIL